MKRTKKLICLLLCFSLLWNSTSYLAEAQGTDNKEMTTDGSDIITGEGEKVENQQALDDVDKNDKLEKKFNEDNKENIKLLDLESQDEGDDFSEGEPSGDQEQKPAEDVIVEKELIRNVKASVDKGSKSVTLQWEKADDYTGLEAVIYKNIDRSDENPITIDLMEKDIVKSLDEEIQEEITEGEESDKEAVLQETVLSKETCDVEFTDGIAYYIDLKPYNVITVEEEADDNQGNIEGLTETEEQEAETYREYGKFLSTAIMFLAKPSVTVKAGDAQCTISWKAVKGASEYEVVDAATGKVVKTLKDTSVKITKLKNSVKYTYQVRAIAELKAIKDAEDVYKYVSDLSAKVSGTTKIVTPSKVSGLTLTPYNLGAILKWKKVSGATQYEIYRYDNKTKKWKSIKKTTSTTYKNTKLTKGRKYTYKVRAIRTAGGKTAKGSFSSTKAITAKKYLTESVHPMYYYARVRSKTSLYKESSGTAKAGSIKAGTKVTVLKRARGGGGRCYVKINGKGYWLARKKLSFYGCKYTTKDYTTAVKEEFVNSSGYSSKTKYLIWVSSYTQKINIFKGSKGKWKLYKTFKCATGKPAGATPQGTYKINKKISRYGVRTYEKYLSCFYGLTSFHSRLYRGGRIVDARIGKPVSAGCIRMYTDEAKFIYKNMPKKTTVVSF